MQKLINLIKKVVYHNLSIHTDDSGTVTGFTLYDIKPFDKGPIVKCVEALNLDWTVIVNDKESMSNKGSMMPPKCYIGKGGATLDDLATALDSVKTSEA